MCNVCKYFVSMYVSVPLSKSGAQKMASDPMKLEFRAVVLQILELYLQTAVNSHVGAGNRIWKTNQCSELLGPLSSPYPCSFKEEHQNFNPGTWEAEAVRSLWEVAGGKREERREETGGMRGRLQHREGERKGGERRAREGERGNTKQKIFGLRKGFTVLVILQLYLLQQSLSPIVQGRPSPGVVGQYKTDPIVFCDLITLVLGFVVVVLVFCFVFLSYWFFVCFECQVLGKE